MTDPATRQQMIDIINNANKRTAESWRWIEAQSMAPCSRCGAESKLSGATNPPGLCFDCTMKESR